MSNDDGVLASRWRAVRIGIWLLIAGLVAAAFALYPPVAERMLSSDGQLSEASKRTLVIAQMGLFVAAGLLLLAARRFRRYTAANERLVMGVLFSVFGVLGAVVLCEAGLWAASGVRPLRADRHFFFLHDEVLGWRHRPGAVALFKEAVVRINGDGLRDGDVPHRRVAGESRVMVLGDSQVFGDGVASEETFVQRLEAEFGSLQAINTAVIGYGTDQQLLYFQHHGRKYELDTVLVGLNAYDLTDNISTKIRSGYVKPRFDLTRDGLQLMNVPIPKGSIADRLQRQLVTRSHLYTLIDQSLSRRASGGRASRTIQASDVFPSERLMQPALEVTQALLAELARSVRSANAQMAVVFLPYSMDFAGDAVYTARVDKLIAGVRAAGQRGGFPVLDLRSSLRSDDDLYLDAVHFNPEGHRRVAAILKTLLEQHRLVPAAHGH